MKVVIEPGDLGIEGYVAEIRAIAAKFPGDPIQTIGTDERQYPFTPAGIDQLLADHVVRLEGDHVIYEYRGGDDEPSS